MPCKNHSVCRSPAALVTHLHLLSRGHVRNFNKKLYHDSNRFFSGQPGTFPQSQPPAKYLQSSECSSKGMKATNLALQYTFHAISMLTRKTLIRVNANIVNVARSGKVQATNVVALQELKCSNNSNTKTLRVLTKCSEPVCLRTSVRASARAKWQETGTKHFSVLPLPGPFPASCT